MAGVPPAAGVPPGRPARAGRRSRASSWAPSRRHWRRGTRTPWWRRPGHSPAATLNVWRKQLASWVSLAADNGAPVANRVFFHPLAAKTGVGRATGATVVGCCRGMGNTAGVAVHNPTLNINPSHTNVTNTNTNVTVNVSVGPASEDRVAVMAGAAGGAAFGAALGGPAGALVGAALGAGAGMVRAHIGRRLPEPSAPRGHPPDRMLVTWLPDEELQAIAHSAAASDSVTCAVCLEQQTAISLQPCGHACLCGACALQIRRRAAAGSTPPLCPVCRNPATGCHRVFLS